MKSNEKLAKELSKIGQEQLSSGAYFVDWYKIARHVQKLILKGKIEELHNQLNLMAPDPWLWEKIEERIADLTRQKESL